MRVAATSAADLVRAGGRPAAMRSMPPAGATLVASPTQAEVFPKSSFTHFPRAVDLSRSCGSSTSLPYAHTHIAHLPFVAKINALCFESR